MSVYNAFSSFLLFCETIWTLFCPKMRESIREQIYNFINVPMVQEAFNDKLDFVLDFGVLKKNIRTIHWKAVQ